MLLVLKILLVPTFIGVVTLAGRRWGPAVSGFLGGLPIIAGPILVFLAIEQGTEFAVISAGGALASVTSMYVFSFIYAFASERINVVGSLTVALSSFLLCTALFYQIELSTLQTFCIVLGTLIITIIKFPIFNADNIKLFTSNKEVAVRMIAAALLVLTITLTSSLLGPKLSGLLTPFPVAGTILAGFTHYNSGYHAARRLLKSFLFGLFGMAVFDLVFITALPKFGITKTLLLGIPLAILSSHFAKRLSELKELKG